MKKILSLVLIGMLLTATFANAEDAASGTDLNTGLSSSETATDGSTTNTAASSEFDDNASHVTDINLATKGTRAGTAVVTLDKTTEFTFKRTAQSEYTLSIPNAIASSSTVLPQVVEDETKGVRSIRAVQANDSVEVRMFVDPASDLIAKEENGKIFIKPSSVNFANTHASDTTSRAQLGEPNTSEEPAKPAEAAPADDKNSSIVSFDGGKTYTGRLISLDLQDTDIDNALRIIAEVSYLNIIASDDVAGKVTLRLIDVPWDQALDVILKTNGLDQVREGNVVRIAPVEKLRQEREALIEAEKAKRELEKLTVSYLRISYARATEVQEQVESVLTERGSVAVDERTNQIIVKDTSDGQKAASELIKRLDLRTPQVLLETQIVEGSRNILRDLGFQWNYSFIQSPEIGNATGLVFPNAINIGGGIDGGAGPRSNQIANFPATLETDGGSAISAILDSADGSRSLGLRLSALEKEGKATVVSRPQIATVNNKEAEIKSVQTLRVRLPNAGTSIATGSGAQAQGGGGSAFQEIQVGITLKVTPQASPDNYVLMDVNAKSSTLSGQAVDNIPNTFDREATSTILVKSGQTFALGGVYRLEERNNVRGIPFLKDIPVIGYLFRGQKTENSDEELIFFITPHIVEGSFDAGTDLNS